jgi:GNAT superfamily N-acetyltransferase
MSSSAKQPEKGAHMRNEDVDRADAARGHSVDQALDIYRDELSDDYDIDDDDVARLRARLEIGDEVLVQFDDAFAIVKGPDTPDQFLTFIWVSPEHRGQQYGRRLIRELMKRYSTYHWSLKCHKRLRPFYSRLGFYEKERHGDTLRMSTNRRYN